MTHTVHTRIDGPLVMIGFGSIGRGTLPLIERHIGFDRSQFTVIEPSGEFAHILHDHGIRHLQLALTPDNYAATLRGLFPTGKGMVVNLSVDVDSILLMELCAELGVQYIDTVVEPWPGFYFGSTLPNADHTNYPLREKVRALGRNHVGGPTAVSCCGANPGMVSWLYKEALLRLAADTGVTAAPKTRAEWAQLSMTLGVKGVHIAERDTGFPPAPDRPAFLSTPGRSMGFCPKAISRPNWARARMKRNSRRTGTSSPTARAMRSGSTALVPILACAPGAPRSGRNSAMW